MSCLFRRKNGIYYVAFLQDRKRRFKSTGKRRKSDAVQFLTELQKHLSKQPRVLLSELLKDFLLFSAANHAAKTYEIYERLSKTFPAFVGDKLIQAIAPLDVERYKQSRLNTVKRYEDEEKDGKKLSPISINIELRALRAIFGWGVKMGTLEKNPCDGVPQLKIPETLPVYLTLDQLTNLMAKIADDEFRTLVKFAVNIGMRRNECLNLRWQDVDLHARIITVTSSPTFKTKTRKVHRVPMNQTVVDMLTHKEHRAEYVFTDKAGRKYHSDYVTHRFKEYAIAAELPKEIHWHSLRHSFASLLVKAEVPLFTVQRLLGHSNIRTTERYSHLASEDLREAVEVLSTTN